MRTLAIETSTVRGSVALVDSERVLATAEHHTPSAHAELILPLIDTVLAEAGVSRRSIERIAVGIGPGSFVGLRVGIALAEGLALGMGCTVVGVPSLHAMARAVPRERSGPRIVLADARRGELFVCVVAADGRELLSVSVMNPDRVVEELSPLGADAVVVGDIAKELDLPWERLTDPSLAFPDARFVACIGAELDAESSPPRALYVRGAGATLPKLPPPVLEECPPSSDLR